MSDLAMALLMEGDSGPDAPGGRCWKWYADAGVDAVADGFVCAVDQREDRGWRYHGRVGGGEAAEQGAEPAAPDAVVWAGGSGRNWRE
jgi:hypothetical protein